MRACSAAIAVALLLDTTAVVAQKADTFPDRAVRMIIPYPPGGGTDLIGRLIAQKLAEAWKQPVLVDNRSGANGMVGAEAVANAKPDGHTLGVVIAAHAINPSLYPKLPYREDAIEPVSLLAEYPFLMAVESSLPVANAAEFIALAKAKAGQLSFASSGSGSGPHLGVELLKQRTGIDMIHIPYRGAAPAQTALIGGHVQMFFSNLLAAAPQLRGGRIRVLAVTSEKRAPALPDVPALAETVPGFSVTGWYGLVAPAGIARPIIARIHGAVTAVLADAEVRERLGADGALAVGSTPEVFRAFLERETKTWATVIKTAGVKPE